MWILTITKTIVNKNYTDYLEKEARINGRVITALFLIVLGLALTLSWREYTRAEIVLERDLLQSERRELISKAQYADKRYHNLRNAINAALTHSTESDRLPAPWEKPLSPNVTGL